MCLGPRSGSVAAFHRPRPVPQAFKALFPTRSLHICITWCTRCLISPHPENGSQLDTFSITCAFVPFSESCRATHAPFTTVMHWRYSCLWRSISLRHPPSTSLSTILKSESEPNRGAHGAGENTLLVNPPFAGGYMYSSLAHCPYSIQSF